MFIEIRPSAPVVTDVWTFMFAGAVTIGSDGTFADCDGARVLPQAERIMHRKSKTARIRIIGITVLLVKYTI